MRHAVLQENSPSTGSVHTLAADVSEAKALEVALLGLEADKGPVNVAICVAGMCIPKLFKDQTLEEARSVMQVLLPHCSFSLCSKAQSVAYCQPEH